MDQALNMNLENEVVHKHYPHQKMHIFFLRFGLANAINDY